MASILAIFTSTPFKNGVAKEGLDFAMSATAYGHSVNAVFIDDGVYQLLEPITNESVYKTKYPSKIAKSLEFFDIENTYVCHHSLRARSLQKNSLSSHYTLIDGEEIRKLIDNHTFVVNL